MKFLHAEDGLEAAYARIGSTPSSLRSHHFEASIQSHLPDMLRVARSVLRGDRHGLASDVVQEVLMRLWRRGTVLPAADAGRVLRHLTACECKHQLRTRLRRRDHEDAATELREEDVDSLGPFRTLAGQELGAQIKNALADLNPDLRAAFELYELEGLDYAGIAARLGIPVGTVRSRLSRARAALREGLHSLCPICGEPLLASIPCSEERVA